MFVLASSCLISIQEFKLYLRQSVMLYWGNSYSFARYFETVRRAKFNFIRFFITLKKRAKISFKETDNIFVNGRNEYVKFSWINSFSKLCLGCTRLPYSRFRISNKRKIHNTVQVNKFACLKFLKIAECFVNELDLYFLRFREQSVASITNFSLQKKNSKNNSLAAKN